MDKNITQKLWLFAAVCFMIAGIAGRNTVFIVLGFAYIGIALSITKKKTKHKDDEEK